ncbi:hypothetical protein OAP63_05285 [Vibrio sp.]|nr:hypothetical protein [Vibrio sp.]
MMIGHFFYSYAVIRWVCNIGLTLCLCVTVFWGVWRPLFANLHRHETQTKNEIAVLLAKNYQTQRQIDVLVDNNATQKSSLDIVETHFDIPRSFRLAQELEIMARKSELSRHNFQWQKEEVLDYYQKKQFEISLSGTFTQLNTFFSLAKQSKGYLAFTYSHWQRERNSISVIATGSFYQSRENKNE